MTAVTQEIFGPVLTIPPCEQLDDAVEAANALHDGLAGYVFAGDRDEAFAVGSRLHVGEVRLGGARVLDLAGGSRRSFWGTGPRVLGVDASQHRFPGRTLAARSLATRSEKRPSPTAVLAQPSAAAAVSKRRR
jgi:acyl-CoA reductase-like NAD-dependent aldehyde dehydrogenase